jgi:DNA gyrase subunit B
LDQYDASQIQILEGLKAVRKVPGMYIGNTGEGGLHHLVYEVVDNCVDEANAGFADKIYVTLGTDGSVTVEDNGRGIPVDIHPQYKRPALEIVLTELHSGAKFDKKVYKVTGGLHGVGVHVVNALSEKLIAVIKRDGNLYYEIFRKGIPDGQLVTTPKEKKDEEDILKDIDLNLQSVTGTTIKFWPDPEIFPITIYSEEILERRMKELAYLNPALTIIIEDKRINSNKTFHHSGGLSEFVSYLSEGYDLMLKETISGKDEKSDVIVEYAIQYSTNSTEIMKSFVNNIRTDEGGTHVAGFRTGLSKAILDFAKKKNLIKGVDNLIGDDVRDGLVAVLHVKMYGPQFEGQTKEKLGNGEIKGIVQSILDSQMKFYLESYPNIANNIVKRALMAAEAREASRNVKELIKKRSSLESGSLPGKLADCSSSDPSKTEIYLVEGDSAGGSAKQARNREYQAVMPLRGKILNVEKANDNKTFSNQVIKDLVSVLGVGVGEDLKLENLRYSKIIIMTDADVDGAHIRTLLLTFFYRHTLKLIKNGNIYFAEPPLYRVQKGDKIFYVYSEEERDKIVSDLGKNVVTQRFKGLGEMNPEQLWDTAMNPDSRRLVQVEIDDAIEADHTFSILMGDKVEPRRKFIEENAKYVVEIDF